MVSLWLTKFPVVMHNVLIKVPSNERMATSAHWSIILGSISRRMSMSEHWLDIKSDAKCVSYHVWHPPMMQRIFQNNPSLDYLLLSNHNPI